MPLRKAYLLSNRLLWNSQIFSDIWSPHQPMHTLKLFTLKLLKVLWHVSIIQSSSGSIFKSFNVNNLSVCIGWCANQVTLRSAWCNDKDDSVTYVEILYTKFHLSHSRSVENMDLKLFMPLRRFWLLFSKFSWNLRMFDCMCKFICRILPKLFKKCGRYRYKNIHFLKEILSLT